MRKFKIIFVLFALIFSLLKVNAQKVDDPILLNVAGENITKSEFLKVYQKNNIKDQPIDRKALEEYLELYINFKLKVKEAENLGLDTVKTFISELNGYRSQLAQPYLVDKDVTDKLVKEAYDRMQYDVRASHILIKVDRNASPADTLAAYQKIMKLRERIIAGERFEKVAAEASDDPSAKDMPATNDRPAYKGNGGDLGYFTAFDMIYSFETGAYNTKVGEVSQPIRSDYGYHLIKVTDKKKAMGRVQVAHILIMYPSKATDDDKAKAKAKAFEVMQKIKNGNNFDDLVKEYSDDKASASKGGVLPEFGVNRMIPEFVIAISQMNKPGDISEPIESKYGWHILKLIEKKGIKPLEELQSDIKQKIQKDDRSNLSKESFLAKVKKKYNFTENPKTIKDFYKVVTDSIFNNAWKAEEAKNLNAVMFTIGNKVFTQKDFAEFLAAKQERLTPMDIQVFVNNRYKEWLEWNLFQYADSKLEDENPDFKTLVKEYHDGILLFDLTDKNVWSKAIKDTVGLKEFYEKNKMNYMWGERLEATIFNFNNTKVKEKDARKFVEKVQKGNLLYDNVKMTKLISKLSKDSAALEYKTEKFSKGDNKYIDKIDWKPGISQNITDNDRTIIVLVHKTIAPEPKSIPEAKGIITADYQNYLEKEWLKYLRNKYTYNVNMEVFNSIK